MRYAIQCDRLHNLPNGLSIWSTLMALAQPVDEHEFADICDGSDLLEEGETFLDYCCSDPDGGFYRCELPEGPVYFMQTSGFEFFFTSSGRAPTYYDPAHLELTYESQRNGALSRLLMGPNDGRINGENGKEAEPRLLESGLEVIEGTHSRYRLIVDGQPVAGMKVIDGVISDIYVRQAHRRMGVASEMMSLVEAELGSLEPSSIQTEDGKAFFSSRRSIKRDDEEGLEF